MPSQSIFDLAIAKQTAKGTAATTAAYRLRVAGGTPMPTREVNDLEETSPNRLRAQSFVASVGVEGAPETFVRLPSLGLIMWLTMGAKSVTGSADPWSHTITLANSQPWFTCWRMVGDMVYEKFVDCKIAQLVLTSEAGSPVKAQFTINGLRHETISQANYATQAGGAPLDDGDPLMHYDGAGKFLVENTAVGSIERIVTTINNNTARQQGDSVGGFDVSEGMRDIQIETTQTIDDAAMYNRFHYGSASPTTGTGPSPATVELTGANGVDFEWEQEAGPPARSLRLQAPRLQVTAIGGYEPGSGNDPLKRTSTYKVYSPASGSGLTAVIKNAVATY
jgi:hypothetical protein